MAQTQLSPKQLGPLALDTASGEVSGILPTPNGGTGLAAPGSSGNVLTSNGTTWTSSAPAGGAGAPDIISNANTTEPNPFGSADVLLTGSTLAIGGRIKAGTILKFRFSMTKTAAGTAAPIYAIKFGTLGTILDTTRLSLTGVPQTAAVDTGWHEITVVFRTVGASGTIRGTMIMDHINTTTGLQNVAQVRIIGGTSAAFDTTTAGLIVSVAVNVGALANWTYQLVQAEAINLE